eukprot:1201159-Prymnesium_polylepis.1
MTSVPCPPVPSAAPHRVPFRTLSRCFGARWGAARWYLRAACRQSRVSPTGRPRHPPQHPRASLGWRRRSRAAAAHRRRRATRRRPALRNPPPPPSVALWTP